MSQVQGQGVTVDGGGKRGMCFQRLEFGAEQEGVALPAVIQRLFAHPVARQRQHPVAAIPQGDGEHADHPAQRVFYPPLRKPGQQGFGV